VRSKWRTLEKRRPKDKERHEAGPAKAGPVPYPFTPNDAANRLLASDGTALLIGLCLDQQVRTETAFEAPFRLRARIKTVAAAKVAALHPASLAAAFRAKPALHRYPGMMSKRVRALCAVIARDYAGKGSSVWRGAKSADAAFERLCELPGFGRAKASCGVRILGKFGGIRLAGWERFGADEDLPWVYENGRRL